MPDLPPVPKGLVFFSEEASPAYRRHRLLFVAILLVTAAALVWPAYTLAADAFPLILGLPLSLSWPVLWLTVMFGALIWLYRTEA